MQAPSAQGMLVVEVIEPPPRSFYEVDMRRICFLSVVVVTLVTAACTQAPCESAQNCVRTVSCLNADTNVRADCSIGYRCEGDTLTCEDAYSTQTDDEFCGEYAGGGVCGVFRCQTDAECRKKLSCPLLDGNGAATGQTLDIELEFICDQATGTCDPDSTRSDAELCADL